MKIKKKKKMKRNLTCVIIDLQVNEIMRYHRQLSTTGMSKKKKTSDLIRKKINSNNEGILKRKKKS